jgi:glucokinase
MASRQLVIGIDLGGTKIAAALVDGAGEIVAQDYRDTRAREGRDKVVARVLHSARAVIEESGVQASQIAGIGIGAPGPIDVASGAVVAPPNLPGWERVPLKQLIEDNLAITTYLENDANAAALGEHRFGSGRGVDHLIYVVVGTGVGGGLILDGRLYHGASGMAGEIGHIVVKPDGPICSCGRRGCLEALTSGPSIAREARQRMREGTPTLIAELAEGDESRVTAKLVAQAAERGDKVAKRVLAEAMHYLGLGMASLVHTLNPELIVFGGGVANLGERMFGPVREAIAELAFPEAARAVRVAPAQLGENAGVLGAAAVALAQLD